MGYCRENNELLCYLYQLLSAGFVLKIKPSERGVARRVGKPLSRGVSRGGKSDVLCSGTR